MSEIAKGFNQEYKNWLREIKEKIKGAQIRAALSANRELIDFYYDLGRMISEKDSVWGSRLLERLSIDLKKEFPQMQGFSVTNLKYCRLFFKYFLISPQTGDEPEKIKSPRTGDELEESSKSLFYQAVVRIPWGHVKLLIDKIKDHNEALFYINQTVENGWSRDVLALQIKSCLFKRSGKAVTNFALRDIGKPMGVSEFEILEKLPENLRSSLPTIEEIETELQKQLEEK
jgi:predicted nuclease of restriction endonuclease-like (RecB) superfamily